MLPTPVPSSRNNGTRKEKEDARVEGVVCEGLREFKYGKFLDPPRPCLNHVITPSDFGGSYCSSHQRLGFRYVHRNDRRFCNFYHNYACDNEPRVGKKSCDSCSTF